MTRSMASRLMSLGFALLNGRKDSSQFLLKNMMDKPIPESGYNSIARQFSRLEGDLNRKLIECFQATCNRPGNHFDLTRIKQKGDKPLRDYIKRFCAKKAEIPNVPDQQIITAFLGGIHSDDLVQEIGRRNHDLKLTAQECFEITDKYASGESALDDIRGKGKEKRSDKPESSKKDKKRKPDNAVNTVDRFWKNPRMNQPSTDELLSGG
ncbi:hypothetical protein PR202_gb16250 [Eleusine coracana subsp. coracana]|uniref:Retrotransposon gag domain-containing protein n=1 Tax=Eleusine coracana subsp. coracana TaxID=191504 RepID=A0AAV5EZR0_ELECO|nr:hypothetical protein PR202_gb16250 [Eleusine coracana subsp. coracana]